MMKIICKKVFNLPAIFATDFFYNGKAQTAARCIFRGSNKPFK